jgi:cytochrome P450
MARLNTLWSAPALALLTIASVTIGAPMPAHAAPKILTEQGAIQAQKQEEEELKKTDKNYAKQANAQAQYYRKLAQQVTKSGGNAQPLLDAAAYFDSEGKK